MKEVAIQKERTDLTEEKRKDDHMHSIRSPGKRNLIYNKSITSAKRMTILCENLHDKKNDEIKNKDKKRRKVVQDSPDDKKKDEITNEDKKRKKVVCGNLDDEKKKAEHEAKKERMCNVLENLDGEKKKRN